MVLVDIRKKLNITQAQLADLMGVSPGHVGDIERGHRKLTIKLADKLEAATKMRGIVAAVVAEQRSPPAQDAAA